MRILIVTAGSRGDVAPFTGLGQGLRRAGHQVAVAAHERFAGLVRDAGLEHRELPGDAAELARERTGNPSPSQDDVRAAFPEYLEQLGEHVLAAAQAGTDLVLTAFGPSPLSRLVAEGLGVPSVGAYLAPCVPTREFPPPGWPAGGALSPEENLDAGRKLFSQGGPLYAGALRRLCGLLDLPASRADVAGPPEDWPVCHGFSPSVLPRPADWPASVHVSGYWWPAEPPGWQPPDQLADFLAAGPPPVFVSFGSTPTHRPLDEVIATAVERTGVRAIVQGDAVAELGLGGDDILAIGDVPYEWLFPRMAALVHHAGAGTTAAGLRAGVPAVAVPSVIDQPFWADRLHRLGVAPAPLSLAELTAGTLTDALRCCLGQPAYRDRAAELAQRIRAEDGPAAVLSVITRLVRE